MKAKEVSKRGKASFKEQLEMVSSPKLLAVFSLDIASLMSMVLICLYLNREFFLVTIEGDLEHLQTCWQDFRQ